MPHHPPSHPAVSPYLIVDDPLAVLAFAKQVFGGEEIFRHERPDGGVGHLEIRIDDSVVMVGSGMAGWQAQPAMLHVYVPDVDATYEKALAAGAESLQEPVQKDDPDRRAGVKDSSGISWWIATHMG